MKSEMLTFSWQMLSSESMIKSFFSSVFRMNKEFLISGKKFKIMKKSDEE
jgi:hypothetical protein